MCGCKLSQYILNAQTYTQSLPGVPARDTMRDTRPISLRDAAAEPAALHSACPLVAARTPSRRTHALQANARPAGQDLRTAVSKASYWYAT